MPMAQEACDYRAENLFKKRDGRPHTFMIDTRRVFRCASMASGPPSEP
ncbi:hypothetical protein C8C95_3508 [Acidovorax sp. 99]|nr:hypothetical protein C8C95_3508 [Acidovorax sp. 99]